MREPRPFILSQPDHGDPVTTIHALAKARVLVVGDVMLDRFVYGDVERISPEAPIPVFAIRRESTMLGGSGNVVRNLVAIGSSVCFVAVVGRDEAGIAITSLVGEEATVEPHLIVEAARQTTVKMRFQSGAQQLLRADRETLTPLDAATEDTVIHLATEAMEDVSLVLLSDYGKGVLTPRVIAAVIVAARARGLRVICDPKGRLWDRYTGIDLVTPNRRELAEAAGTSVRTTAEIVAAARQLMERHDLAGMIVTRSEEGMTVVLPDDALDLPARAREVFDVSGAGDTVIACLGAALGAGLPLGEAAALANLAGGVVVGKPGTASVHPAELIAAIRGQSDRFEGRVLDREAMVERVARWHRSGLKIGFTNGCFDLIHPGHVSLLRQARAACDRLIVGLNSDASVRRLKGPSRPLQDEASRAAVLAAFAAVDAVVLFDEDTPLNLIGALRPDILVKGADYQEHEVVGGDLVKSWGGRVLLADLTEGQSTTGIVRRMGGA